MNHNLPYPFKIKKGSWPYSLANGQPVFALQSTCSFLEILAWTTFTLCICPLELIPDFFFLLKKGSGGGRAEWVGRITFILALMESVYLPANKGKHVFILGKQISHFQREMTTTIPVEYFCASVLIFYCLHAVYSTSACILGGKTRLLSLWTMQLGWLGT